MIHMFDQFRALRQRAFIKTEQDNWTKNNFPIQRLFELKAHCFGETPKTIRPIKANLIRNFLNHLIFSYQPFPCGIHLPMSLSLISK